MLDYVTISVYWYTYIDDNSALNYLILYLSPSVL